MKIRYRRLIFITIVLTIACTALIIYLSNTKVILKLMHPLKYEEQIYKYSNEFNIDPYLVFAIVKAESNFDKYAVSHKEAKGLMQITDKTAIWGAQELFIKDFSPECLFDPDINIRIGCWYLNRLKKEFSGNMILAVTAYNGGSGRVQEWLKDKSISMTGKSLDRIPFTETDRYLKKVMEEYKALKYIYAIDNKS